MPSDEVVAGWDIGGAHVKLAIVSLGEPGELELIAVDQWACPLWQGLDRLQAVLAAAQARWPQLAGARHAVTMTGEMVDLFEHREAGVLMLAELLAATLGERLAFWAGADAGAGPQAWCDGQALPARWSDVASANWAATATLAARRLAGSGIGEAVLVDIGSTTTDLIALRGGGPQARGRSDADRLASGELLYQGVVRTPLCALAPRIAHRGRLVNVMNEFFATTADAHRLLGDLDPQHDQQPAADGGGKDLPATRRRLARMVGLDARDASDSDWLALAAAWRAIQLGALRENLERVAAAADIAADAQIVAAGCGDFLAFELARMTGRPAIRFDALVAGADSSIGAGSLRRGLQVGAPAVAVALLQASARAEPPADRGPGSVEVRPCGS